MFMERPAERWRVYYNASVPDAIPIDITAPFWPFQRALVTQANVFSIIRDAVRRDARHIDEQSFSSSLRIFIVGGGVSGYRNAARPPILRQLGPRAGKARGPHRSCACGCGLRPLPP